jgi:hypothetical protein
VHETYSCNKRVTNNLLRHAGIPYNHSLVDLRLVPPALYHRALHHRASYHRALAEAACNVRSVQGVAAPAAVQNDSQYPRHAFRLICSDFAQVQAAKIAVL